jgi:hypothetical protein
MCKALTFNDSANLVVVLLPLVLPQLQHRLSLAGLTQLQHQQDTVPHMPLPLRLPLVLHQLNPNGLE